MRPCFLLLLVVGSSSMDPLGPGKGRWQRESPSAHGLNAEALKQAGRLLGEYVPHRNCLVVVKDGVIVHEDYYENWNMTRRIETDSLAKTATALVIGVAVQQGLIDIDLPISHNYNVTPICDDGTETCWR